MGCSHLTIGRVLRGYGLPPAPRHSQRRWREFVRRRADLIIAVDYFVVDTAWLSRLYVIAAFSGLKVSKYTLGATKPLAMSFAERCVDTSGVRRLTTC